MTASVLPVLKCPKCNRALPARSAKVVAQVSRYEDCLRRCDDHGIGFSNARDQSQATVIYRNHEDNLPPQLVEGLGETFAHVLNIRHRLDKPVKFGFSTSEDALTWAVFRYCQMERLWHSLLTVLGTSVCTKTDDEPALLLWGVPVPFDSPRGHAVMAALVAASNKAGESPISRSEPDVMLDFGEGGLVVIEVKGKSPNEAKNAEYAGWTKRGYLASKGFSNRDRITDSTLYELARNWAIGWDVAAGRPFHLVNLGPASLFEKQAAQLATFKQGLRTDSSHGFQMLTWSSFLASMPSMPDWLKGWLDDRKRLTGIDIGS
jgi:hypothetical protein